MTPALPGEAPDPSATPRLDALLRDVESREARERHLWDVFENKAFPFRQSDAARLAAIVRVLVEGMNGVLLGTRTYADGWAALARAEAMAKGE